MSENYILYTNGVSMFVYLCCWSYNLGQALFAAGLRGPDAAVVLALALALLESPSSVAGEPRPGSAAQVRPAFSG